MKRLILLLTIFIVYTSSYAQEGVSQTKERRQEVGIIYDTSNQFGISYKIGHNRSMWRFNTLGAFSVNDQHHEDSLIKDTKATSFKIAIGKEFRKSIGKKLELRYGLDIGFRYDHSNNSSALMHYRKTDLYYEGYTTSIGFVFGFNYYIFEDLIMGVEMIPAFSVLKGESKYHSRSYTESGELISDDENITQIDKKTFNLSNQNVILTLSYKF
ncbi:hypothetical protein [Flammeovirga aprica]|uniref:Outer membrane protein beta-barrel domain-containing protein n=1 Tax=Flammeovirga aprica JL-4 TaxID=694437 RepID=A0A7X9RVW1_9BACT|nr:hypothetical protein [Flammeovirga aprica]NME69693.1 hypothetical protein [Flammeovirga aprica JL-4]